MAQLNTYLNTQTGEVESLTTAPEAHHVPVADGRVGVSSPDGRVGDIPVENLKDAIGRGFSIMGAEQVRHLGRVEEEADLPGAQGRTLVESAVSGATLGLARPLFGEEGLARAEAFPATAVAGELVGAVGPALLSGGAGAAGAAARLTPAGALAATGAKVGGAVATKAGAVVGAAAAGAVEGSVAAAADTWGRQVAAQQPLDIEGIASSAGWGAALGGGAGGALGLIGKGFGKIILDKSKEAVDLNKVSGALDDLDNKLTDAITEDVPLSKDGKALKVEWEANRKAIAARHHELKTGKPVEPPMEFAPNEWDAGKAREFVTWVQGTKGMAIKTAKSLGPEVDDKARALLATDQELADLFGMKKFKTPTTAQLTEVMKKDADKFAEVMELRRNLSLDILDMDPERVAGRSPMTKRGRLRDTMPDATDPSDLSRIAQQDAFEDMLEQARRAKPLPPVTMAEAAEFADDAVMRDLATKHRDYSLRLAMEADPALKDKMSKGNVRAFAEKYGVEAGLIGYDMSDGELGAGTAVALGKRGALAAAKKFLVGGIPAGAANLARQAVNHILPGNGFFTSGAKSVLAGAAYREFVGVTRALRKGEIREQLSKAALARRESIRNGVSLLGRKSGKAAPYLVGQAVSREQAKKEMQEIRLAAASRQQTQQRIFDNLTALREVDPLAADKAEMASLRILDVLESRLPKNPQLGTWGQGERWTPSDAEIHRYKQDKAICEDPTIIFQKLDKGTLNVKDVQLLRDAFPETYNEIRMNIIENLPDLQGKLDYSRRVALSALFGVPVDSTMRPEFLRAMQLNHMQQQAQQQEQPANMNNMKRPEPTPAQRLTGTGE